MRENIKILKKGKTFSITGVQRAEDRDAQGRLEK